MKTTKRIRFRIALLLLAAMAAVLLGGCGTPEMQESSDEPAQSAVTLPEKDMEESPDAERSESAEDDAKASEGKNTQPSEEKPKDTSGKDAYQTDPVPTGKPEPVEPQDTETGTERYTCTISISCATILDNLDRCDSDKVELVPKDGWILPPTEVEFYEGESVFNVLQRTCKQQKIHMEYENTPLYNSAYIEGIHNLYEFDVGELSGWMYSVNGWFPNYGCSRYQLQDGDVICWVYTCDLGADVGGADAAQKDE